MEHVNTVDHYIINQKTIMLTGEYDNYGNLFTKVIEGNHCILVKQSPLKLISDTMHYYGHNLKGAIEGAQSILGKIQMCPIMVSSEQDICLFPHKSPMHADCIWFSYKHVIQARTEEGYTLVELSNGHFLKIKIRLYSFNHKKQNAGDLRRILQDRSKSTVALYFKPRKEYRLSKDSVMAKLGSK